MNPMHEQIDLLTRRHFFGRTGLSPGNRGALDSARAKRDAAPRRVTPRRSRRAVCRACLISPPKAKRAIYLHMNGGPSQMDLFDYKPKMGAMFDKDLPDSIRMGQRLTTMTSGQSRFPIAPSKYKFAQHGSSGMWISELLPWTAKLADQIALVKTVWTEAINHDPAVTYICTGHQLPGRPSLGAWLCYGLGTMNQNLPAFVVMTASWSSKAAAQAIYNRLWGTGYLPTKHQGVALRSTGDPVLFLSNPPGVDAATRKRTLDAIVRMNQHEFEQIADPETRRGSPSTRWHSGCRPRCRS